jgi:hypothetical protein
MKFSGKSAHSRSCAAEIGPSVSQAEGFDVQFGHFANRALCLVQIMDTFCIDFWLFLQFFAILCRKQEAIRDNQGEKPLQAYHGDYIGQ